MVVFLFAVPLRS